MAVDECYEGQDENEWVQQRRVEEEVVEDGMAVAMRQYGMQRAEVYGSWAVRPLEALWLIVYAVEQLTGRIVRWVAARTRMV